VVCRLPQTLDCGIQMLAVRASSSSRQVKQRAPRTSRSGKATVSLVERRGNSKRRFIWSVVWRFAPACCAAQSVVAWRSTSTKVAPARRASRVGATACEAAAHAQKLPFEFCRRWCMLRCMANSTRSVAVASVLRRLAGVKSPVAQGASSPQPNHSVKRTAPGVPGSAAYLKR
jgi:hypothetical protein